MEEKSFIQYNTIFQVYSTILNLRLAFFRILRYKVTFKEFELCVEVSQLRTQVPRRLSVAWSPVNLRGLWLTLMTMYQLALFFCVPVSKLTLFGLRGFIFEFLNRWSHKKLQGENILFTFFSKQKQILLVLNYEYKCFNWNLKYSNISE